MNFLLIMVLILQWNANLVKAHGHELKIQLTNGPTNLTYYVFKKHGFNLKNHSSFRDMTSI